LIGSTLPSELHDQHHAFPDGSVNYGAFSVETLQQQAQEQYSVQRVTLDDLYYEQKAIPCPHFMKLDVECHEIKVLLGAEKLLSECKPLLYFEADCDVPLPSVQVFLRNLGYSLAWISLMQIDLDLVQNNTILRDPSFGPMALFSSINILAVPNGEWADAICSHYGSKVLVPIDVENSKYYIQDYDIEACFAGHWCFKKVGASHNATHCSKFVQIDDHLINLYKKYK
jgi:hypothetical protein